MRITRLPAHVVGAPRRNLTYAQVHTDEGLSGIGETRTLGHTDALLGYLKEAERNRVAGSDPVAIEDLVHRLSTPEPHSPDGAPSSSPRWGGRSVLRARRNRTIGRVKRRRAWDSAERTGEPRDYLGFDIYLFSSDGVAPSSAASLGLPPRAPGPAEAARARTPTLRPRRRLGRR